MAGESKITTDHETIKNWVESRGGAPAAVKATKGKGKNGGVLRIDFPGYSGKGSLEKIAWDDFFEVFEDRELAFLYQDELKSGEESRFFKFISRAEDVKGEEEGEMEEEEELEEEDLEEEEFEDEEDFEDLDDEDLDEEE